MAHRGVGEIRADVTVTGDAVGQLARGSNTAPDAGRARAGQRRHRPAAGRAGRRRAPVPRPACFPAVRRPSSAATTRPSRCSPSWRPTGPSHCRRRPAWARRRCCATSPTTPTSPPPTARWCACRRAGSPATTSSRPCSPRSLRRPGAAHPRAAAAAPAPGARRGAPRRRRPAPRRRRRAAVPRSRTAASCWRAPAPAGSMRTVPLSGLPVDAAGELLAHVVGTPLRPQRGVRALGGRPGRARGARPARGERERVPDGGVRRGGPARRRAAVHRGHAAGPAAARAARGRARRRAVRGAADGGLRPTRRGGADAPVGRLRAGDGVRRRHLRVRGRRAGPGGVGIAAAPCGAGRGRSRRGRVATPTPCSSRAARRSRCGCCRTWPGSNRSWRAVLAIGGSARRRLRPRGPLGRLALLPAGDAGGRARPRRPGRGGLGAAPARHRRALPRRPGHGPHAALRRTRAAPGAGPARGRRGHPAEPRDDHRPTRARPAPRRGRARADPHAGEGRRRAAPAARVAGVRRAGAGRSTPSAQPRPAAARVRRPGRRQGQRAAGRPARQRRPGRAARRQRRARRRRTTARSRSSTRAASARSPAGGGCTATVVFTPATPGEQQASLSWRIREIPAASPRRSSARAWRHSRPLPRVPSLLPRRSRRARRRGPGAGGRARARRGSARRRQAPAQARLRLPAPARGSGAAPRSGAVPRAPAACPGRWPGAARLRRPRPSRCLRSRGSRRRGPRPGSTRVGCAWGRSRGGRTRGWRPARSSRVTPAAGHRVPRGSAVNLVGRRPASAQRRGAAGRRPVLARSPQPAGPARTLGRRRGHAAPSRTVAKGAVVSADPAPGAHVRPGAAVGLVRVERSPVVRVAVPSWSAGRLATRSALIPDAKLAVGR